MHCLGISHDSHSQDSNFNISVASQNGFGLTLMTERWKLGKVLGKDPL